MARPKIRQDNAKKVNEFFLRKTPETAYVLGFFAADGCMYDSINKLGVARCIEFTSTDWENIENIKRLMGVSNKIETCRNWKQDSSERKERYKIRFVNKEAYGHLQQIGFTPRKSLTLQFPTELKNDLLADFTRGYLDGDGCVYFKILKRKDRPRAYPIFNVRFTCGSKDFLKTLQTRLMKAIDIGSGSLHRHTSAWDLSYSYTDAIKICEFIYYRDDVPCLDRKRRKFKQALAIAR